VTRLSVGVRWTSGGNGRRGIRPCGEGPGAGKQGQSKDGKDNQGTGGEEAEEHVGLVGEEAAAS